MEVPFDKSVRLFVSNHSDRPPALIWNDESLIKFACKNSTFFARHMPFFKCSVFVYDEFDCLVKSICQFSTCDVKAYADHLKKKHIDETNSTFYACFYCYESTKKFFQSAIHLARHIVKKHGARLFQCNQCSYRAISCEHVSLHQAIKHSSNIADCNILFSSRNPPLSDNFRLKYFYDHSRIPKIDTSLYQCLFCPVISVLRTDLLAHYVDHHPDFPMLYYTSSIENQLNTLH